jgi:hypothetical protein
VLDEASRERLTALYAALDPVRLLRQLQMLQEALWRHAVVNMPVSPGPTERFAVTACGLSTDEREQADVLSSLASTGHTRKYHRTAKSLAPRTYRTRKDPFEGEWDEIQSWLASAPERTAKSIFLELQQRYPDRHPKGQLRTLQRRISEQRAKALLEFTDGWLPEDTPVGQAVPGPLRLRVDGAAAPAAR